LASSEDPIEMAKHAHVKIHSPTEDLRHAQDIKIARLRALRLEKEEADREAANRAAALMAEAPRSRASRAKVSTTPSR
jgi:hypothetical protein